MAHGILIAGLLLILIGSEVTMWGTVGLARQFDMPPLLAGVLVISLVTVLPEFFIFFRAVTMSRYDIALGGLIGTNIINMLFVMGLGALIHPMASSPKVVFRDGGVLLIGCAGLIVFAILGGISRQAGAILSLLFAAYVALTIFTDWRRAPEHSVPLARALYRSEGPMPSLMAAIFLAILGIIMLALGSHLAVLGSIHFATELGWTGVTVGLTVVAAGMSSPKLLATLVSAARGQSSIEVGQLLNAGVCGLFAVLGLVALIHPIVFPAALAETDVYILAAAALALLPLLAMRWRLSRPRGILLIVAYGCYVAFLLLRQPLPWGH